MSTIKIGYLISYDYEFVKNSLPGVYTYALEIILAVDADRRTWSGKDFVISEDFWEWIRAFDKDHKIRIYEDNFFIPDLSPIECETRERNLLAKEMGECDWYLQLDADEYFVDFETVWNKLKQFKPDMPTTVRCKLATLFKQTASGYLLIEGSVEPLNFATNNPVYDLARSNNSGNEYIYWDDLVLHQSWARSQEEIKLKLSNWGHRDDFNTNSFFKLWDAIDEFNYYCLSNFHPLTPDLWPRLKVVKGSIAEILKSPEARELGIVKAKKRKPLLSRLWKEIRSRE